MNTIKQDIGKYLSLRRSLGYKLRGYDHILGQFADFLQQRSASYITRNLALAWLQQCNGKSGIWNQRLVAVRGFALCRQGTDPRTEIPEPTSVPSKNLRAKPYLYSDIEIEQLLQALVSRPARCPRESLLPLTCYCLIGLLSVTGMRLSEACNLKVQDVDLQAAIVTIRTAKHARTRLVPLHESTCQVLAEYIEQRQCHWHSQVISDYLFVSSRGNRLTEAAVRARFAETSRQIGLRGPSDRRGPRLHDLRHRFATRVLEGWYQQNQDPQRLLPVLSAMLGHVCIRDTYWYLESSPGLMSEAMQRMEHRWETTS